ncbi:ATP-dependent DNA helicase RecG [Andreesenia angusta]|uniref:ATP-dependent DNA helicase RecG n=1 Tax=Andreesenia angusta TaxID=39480 RepID=A0A1S1V7S0_9FIRM|nr:ATP-dependent DNA helicase RecG [Andreesenia angusta]OHW62653.1 ATP-dependent DNA helicase RecG [Andreesenia angusta]
MYSLEDDILAVKGIGEKKAEKLKKLGISSVEDLINYLPRSYEDRSAISELKSSKEGEKINAVVELLENPRAQRLRGGKAIVKVLATDGTEKVYLSWFNQPYIAREISQGEKLKISGAVKRRGAMKEISNPIYTKNLESCDKVGSIVPVYPLTQGVGNQELAKHTKSVLEELQLEETIPEYIRSSCSLMGRLESLREIHFPKDREKFKRARVSLAFEELIGLQLSLLLLKSRRESLSGCISFSKTGLEEKFLGALPFELTDAQKRVSDEIERDMKRHRQMNRLVQGDVGSGKTVVGALALLRAVGNGYQGAMMAPTEILAKQHFNSLSAMTEKLGVRLGLLVSNMKASEKRELLESVRSGEIDILVGTHAIIEDYLEFRKLGIVITDEQHRFGVSQRAKLSGKGESPDILVMTATPIPRTLALMLYGDLEISIIDGLPPGRKEIKTYARGEEARDKVYGFVRDQLSSGRQAYVVCPLVEDSELMDLKSAESVYEELSIKFGEFRVGLLHGKQKALEKDEIMTAFKAGDIDVLVSTTVIEVGVDVPNSNIMVVENSERFGLSQLHQLRGRVGRGKHQSYCILINCGKGKTSKERASIMEETSDGFVISEKDLELRGPGEFFGIKQHGLPELRIAKLPRDVAILSKVQEVALSIVEEDQELALEKNVLLKSHIEKSFLRDKDIAFN